MALTANYSNLLSGKRSKPLQSSISQPGKVRLIKDGNLHSERCVYCGVRDFDMRKHKLIPRMETKVQHKKGCKSFRK
jgi:hypothetical protein